MTVSPPVVRVGQIWLCRDHARTFYVKGPFSNGIILGYYDDHVYPDGANFYFEWHSEEMYFSRRDGGSATHSLVSLLYDPSEI